MKTIFCIALLALSSLTLAACADGSATPALTPDQQYAKDVSDAVARQTQTIANYAQSGVTHVEITLAPSGALMSAHILTSSGTEGLDNFALQAVDNAHYPVLPASLPQQPQSFDMPVNFISHPATTE